MSSSKDLRPQANDHAFALASPNTTTSNIITPRNTHVSGDRNLDRRGGSGGGSLSLTSPGLSSLASPTSFASATAGAHEVESDYSNNISSTSKGNSKGDHSKDSKPESGGAPVPNLGPVKRASARLSRSNTIKEPKDGKAPSVPTNQTSAIDPLSQQIFMRTNTDHTIAQRLWSSTAATTIPDSPAGPTVSEGMQNTSSDLSLKQAAKQASSQLDVYIPKDKKKGSFLSRLSMIGSKKRDDESRDSDSQISEKRTDGHDAQVFTVSGAACFIPHHKEPPRYIRVRAHNKKNREFNRMFLAQELEGTVPPPPESITSNGIESNVPTTTAPLRRPGPKTGGAIWSMEFSQDGKYLAAAGKDQVVRIWAVISTHEERRAHEEEEMATGDGRGERLSAPVFGSKPIREFRGHTGEVLDLSWSKNNFLLSSSMDKTVRLWHISRTECLCIFSHPDFVTSIAFHPTDDRFFLAGSLDSLLRLWSIPDKAVAFSAKLQDLITAVAFSPDGKTAIAGVLNGLCYFYETEGLKFQTQIHVRSSRGKNAKGSKITGISTIVIPPTRTPPITTDMIPEVNPLTRDVGAVKVLVTSNDSRIRIYDLKDKSLETKFKGHENACSQISASFSDDAQYVICGSEDRRAFIWDTTPAENENKRPDENFEAHNDIVTVAVFAPTKTRQLLGASGDPIYDLCNPPPVTLLSREESVSVSEDQHSEVGNVPSIKKPEESPAYIARSTHYDGNIVVTADHAGIIKVFRQDCAWSKRRHESWDAGSLSRRLGPGVSVSRTGSIATRANGSRSRRGSLTQTQHAVTPQGSSDRILSWRAEVGDDGHSVGTPATTRSERSVSPHKSGVRTPLSSSVANLAADARKAPYQGSLMQAHRDLQMPTSPTSSMRSMQSSIAGTANHKVVGILKKRESVDASSKPTTPSFSITAPGEVRRGEKEGGEKDRDDASRPTASPPSSATGTTSFWGRWKGISSLSLRPAAGAWATQATTNGGPVTKAIGSEIASMDPASFEDDEVVYEEANRNATARRKDATNTRRKSIAETIGTKPDTEAETDETPRLKEKRRKSVGFINIKPGRDSYEDSWDQDDSSSRAHIQYPTRRDSRASTRHSLPPGVLRHSVHSSRGTHAKADGSPSRGREHGPAKVVSARPGIHRDNVQRDSVVSTSGMTATSSDGEDVRCSACGGKEFKVKHVKGTNRQRFLCGRCGTLGWEVGG